MPMRLLFVAMRPDYWVVHIISNQQSMGEYIRTGIITEFWIYPSQVSKMDMRLKETRIGLATAIVGNPQSFDCKEEDGKFVWKLKPNVIEAHLPGFLKRYFNDFYEEGSALYNKYCKLTLDYLS